MAPATVDARGGQAAYDALIVAARLALERRVDAITTGPLHKAALARAGHNYPGHTELLAELCGVDDFAMMLYLGHCAQVRGSAGLAIVHVTLHMALRQAIVALDEEGVLRKARLVSGVMTRLKGSQPRRGRVRAESACGRGRIVRRRGTAHHSAGRRARAGGRPGSRWARCRPTR